MIIISQEMSGLLLKKQYNVLHGLQVSLLLSTLDLLLFNLLLLTLLDSSIQFGHVSLENLRKKKRMLNQDFWKELMSLLRRNCKSLRDLSKPSSNPERKENKTGKPIRL